MSEISSGLVAVAWQHSQRGLGDSEWQEWKTISWKPQGPESERFRMRPLCVISDAEAKLSECVTSYEKEVAGLTAELDAKDVEIERLALYKNLADEYGLSVFADLKEQASALKLAREALFDMQDSYAAIHGWKDSFVIAATTAIAAIDALGE